LESQIIFTVPNLHLRHLIGVRRNVVPLLLLTLTSLVAPPSAAQGSSNRLAGSDSAYLKRAAQQPVDWYPWSPEAWEIAKQLDRPVLLDLGAVWCGWCNLMDRESYNRPDLAAFINANFIAVKVDYDAQPHLAAELERAQAVLNLPSGLPLTGFVTPGGKLYFGGCYFPRQAKGDKPAFEDALKQALRMYREHRSQVERDGLELKKER
jgi:uncharacterized protein YyaL (SSP411 family)